jgi:ubiquinone/menaquinone biosynthesis C-methylase UbiE
MNNEEKGAHVCPWWIGWILASPIRRIFHNPEKLLAPYVGPGMNVLDVGSAMGFFTLPMARMTGQGGRVVAVDMQERMLRGLEKRARKKKLHSLIETRLCSQESLELDDLPRFFDFVLASAVVHEVPDRKKFFREVYAAMRPGGILLVAEPGGHVTVEDFEATLASAEEAGFRVRELMDPPGTRAALLARPDND